MSSYSKELLPIAGAGTDLLPQYLVLGFRYFAFNKANVQLMLGLRAHPERFGSSRSCARPPFVSQISNNQFSNAGSSHWRCFRGTLVLRRGATPGKRLAHPSLGTTACRESTPPDEYISLFDDLCADRGFCAAQGYAPEDSLDRHFRKDKDIEAPNRFQYLAPSGRCWDVLEARGNHWRGMDPALWREWDPALWRDLSTWWRCCCKVHMVAKRDSDVPTVCQASPRGVATKAIVEADLRFNRAQGGNKCEGSRLMINDC